MLIRGSRQGSQEDSVLVQLGRNKARARVEMVEKKENIIALG